MVHGCGEGDMGGILILGGGGRANQSPGRGAGKGGYDSRGSVSCPFWSDSPPPSFLLG